MTNTHSNQTPADALAAIIARGVACYQESLPEYARDPAPFAGLPDHARPLDELPEPEPRFVGIDEDVQRALCLSCPLADCVGTENPRCPIRVEQRRRWQQAEKARKETINADMRHL